MILRGHNLFLSSFAGCTLCFAAGNFGTWYAKDRPNPKNLGYKKIIDDVKNAGELFKLVLKEHKDRVKAKFGNIRDESEIRNWCASNADNPWVKDYQDALDFCYTPKKVAYRLASEGYRLKEAIFTEGYNDEKCSKDKIWDAVNDGAVTVNLLKVKGDCVESKASETSS